METIKNYMGTDPEIKRHILTLEMFIGDVDNSEYKDDGTFDTSDAVTALNSLIALLRTVLSFGRWRGPSVCRWHLGGYLVEVRA